MRRHVRGSLSRSPPTFARSRTPTASGSHAKELLRHGRNVRRSFCRWPQPRAPSPRPRGWPSPCQPPGPPTAMAGGPGGSRQAAAPLRGVGGRLSARLLLLAALLAGCCALGAASAWPGSAAGGSGLSESRALRAGGRALRQAPAPAAPSGCTCPDAAAASAACASAAQDERDSILRTSVRSCRCGGTGGAPRLWLVSGASCHAPCFTRRQGPLSIARHLPPTQCSRLGFAAPLCCPAMPTTDTPKWQIWAACLW